VRDLLFMLLLVSFFINCLECILIMNIIKKTGEFSSDLLPEAVKNLAEMQSLSDDDFPFWKQVHKFL
jgi:hypothetical protein